MRNRLLVTAMLLLVSGMCVSAQTEAIYQSGQASSARAENAVAAPPATSSAAKGFEISGVLVNAVTGEALSKAKVWVVPMTTNDNTDVQPGPRGQNRFAGGGPGGGGGFAFAVGGGGGGGGFGPGGGGFGRGRAGQRVVNEEEPKTETFTDASGNFVLAGVNPGTYLLYAERKGYPRQPLDQHGNFNTAVVVGAGKESKNILFRVMPDSGITGRITDDFGDPVPNAQVILFARTTDNGQEQVRRRSGSGTDSKGMYRFNHLEPGTYFVVVSAQPWYTMYSRMMGLQANTDGSTPQAFEGDANLDVAFPVTYYPGATDENDATPIQLQPGDHFEADIILNTSPAMHLKFAMPENSGRMMPSISTSAFGQEIPVRAMPSVVRGGPNPEDMTMSVAVAPGHYDANLRTFGGRNNDGGPPTVSKKMSIDATANAVVDINRAEDAAAITGTVKFEGMNEVPRGAVTFRKVDSGQVTTSRSNTEGELATQLFPGKYTVVAAYPCCVIKSISAVGAKVAGRTIEITGSSAVRVSVDMIPDDARIEGVVHAANSESPVASALVVLVPQDLVNDAPLIRRFQSDSDGTFRFSSVIPGKYTVVAIQNGWNLEWGKPEVMKNYLAKGEPIEVTAKSRMKINVKAQ